MAAALFMTLHISITLTKTVFNGNDLGKQYSVDQLQHRCNQTEPTDINQQGLKPGALAQNSYEKNTENAEQAAATDIIYPRAHKIKKVKTNTI